MHNAYNSPVAGRYISEDMSRIFSDINRYSTWRKLWVWLAEAQQEQGLNISDQQILEMERHIYDIDFDRVSEIEKDTHHDVVAHIRAFAEQCPTAAPIIHLGATSCYVTDNTDVMIMRDALWTIRYKLAALLLELCSKAEQYASTPTLGYTHLQPAQPVTVGKRIAMWTQDFYFDLQELMHQYVLMECLGCRGATGTADSFLKLFNGDANKVIQMEKYVITRMGFAASANMVSGQTYSRKRDFYVLQVLSGIAQSASKFATDIRLLASKGEMMEPFGGRQVGSSAMPYKRNPMLCERICSLSRLVTCKLQGIAETASTQWLERSLDDSALRRIEIPEMFILTDTVLDLCYSVAKGMVVDEQVCKKHMDEMRTQYATEEILMLAVSRGGNRQDLHERLRKVFSSGSLTPEVYKYLPIVVSKDEAFRVTEKEVRDIIGSHDFVGMAEQQTKNVVSMVRKLIQ